MKTNFIFPAIIIFAGLFVLNCSSGSTSSGSGGQTDDDSSPGYLDDDIVDDDAGDDDYTDIVLVPAGNFWMGCEPEDTNCYFDEYPRRQVFLSAYYIHRQLQRPLVNRQVVVLRHLQIFRLGLRPGPESRAFGAF